MAWDEWEQIRAEVAARQAGNMQLNSAGDGADADLKTNKQGKQKAINAIADDIKPGLDRVGVHADDNTNAAEREFKGWATGSGLSDAHEEWARQVKSLKSRLTNDQESLGQAKRDFQFVDHDVWSTLIRSAKPSPDPRQDT
ncbi:hypothetical protein [Streptomyces sp. ID01-9D]|uniref:hypothetical protein n=1 Tax=Streptomyces sp. ID01-9D TaxID=3028659 RepID=UPI0029C2C2A1|nr:hypothetical protein [Streptomyces sp. ID01-9D]MDX5572955.1 hypothetical protein [Streptomyces sp. ID01-9D]